MKTAAVLILFCLGLPVILFAAMSDSKAATEAFRIWGKASHISKERTWGASNWTQSIGYLSPGCGEPFTVIGSGANTWDAAFAALPADKGIEVMVLSGISDLAVDSGAMPPLITAFQFKIDGVPVANQVTVTVPVPWKLSTQWDSRTVPDGLHVLCAAFTDAEGNTGITHARMVQVKQ